MKLNKLLTLALVGACMGMVSCKKKDNKPTEPAEVTATLGIGYSASYAKHNYSAKALYSVTAAAVAFDANGVIVACDIDVVQEYAVLNDAKTGFVLNDYYGDGKTFDADGYCKTKVELGEVYGMKDSSEIGKEVCDQINLFEEACIGKTVTQVKQLVAKTGELEAKVSINIGEFQDAIEKAYNNKKANTFTCSEEGLKVGVGMNGGLYASSYLAENNMDEFSCDIAAVAKDGDVIVDAALDVVVCVPDIASESDFYTLKTEGTDGAKYHADGQTILSKLSLKDNYAMKGKQGCTKEWYEQAALIESACVGKTAAQAANLVKDDKNVETVDANEVAGATIKISTLVKAICKAAK